MNIVTKLLKIISLLRRQLIVKTCNKYLGIDFTPADVIPDEVGCAEAVTTILREVNIMNRMIPGTWTLNEYLKNDKNWVTVNLAQAGDIIISPTGTSRKGKGAPFVGHVGIVGNNGIVYANDSYSGKWKTQYSIATWKERYSDNGGYPVYFYRYEYAL